MYALITFDHTDRFITITIHEDDNSFKHKVTLKLSKSILYDLLIVRDPDASMKIGRDLNRKLNKIFSTCQEKYLHSDLKDAIMRLTTNSDGSILGTSSIKINLQKKLSTKYPQVINSLSTDLSTI